MVYTIGMYEYPDIHHYYTVIRTGSVTDVMTSPVPAVMTEGETPSLVDHPPTLFITMHYPHTTIMILYSDYYIYYINHLTGNSE